jgi:polyhydroxyalkanoate synthesis regulator phasin
MAKRRTAPKELPTVARETGDRVRDAVERTVQATMGSAEKSRGRAQEAVDELVGTVEDLRRGAETGLARSGKVVREAVEERLPATQDDVRELKAELRRIARRLDAIEERLPAKRARARGGGGGAKKRSS